MERDQHFWPATMYIEGLDQYRGWFQSSLLVAVGALGRGAPFRGVRHPRLDGGRRGQGHAQVSGQRHGSRRDLREVRRRPAASVGRLRRLPCGRALLRRDLQAAEPELPEVPQHLQVLPGQSGGLRRRPAGAARRAAAAGQVGRHPPERPHREGVRRLRQLRVPCGVPHDQRLLRGGSQLLLLRYHQGSPVLRRGRTVWSAAAPRRPCG